MIETHQVMGFSVYNARSSFFSMDVVWIKPARIL